MLKRLVCLAVLMGLAPLALTGCQSPSPYFGIGNESRFYVPCEVQQAPQQTP